TCRGRCAVHGPSPSRLEPLHRGAPATRQPAPACARCLRETRRHSYRWMTKESPKRTSPVGLKGASVEPGTQWRPVHCNFVTDGTEPWRRTFSQEVLTLARIRGASR